MFRNIFIFVYLNCFAFLKAEAPHIHLPIGSLVGREMKTVAGLTYHSFQGIPFAEPPVGSLRFQAPIEKKPWGNELDATHERAPCYQMGKEIETEREDCLFINVYTPKKALTNQSLPVMFWIYGGAFLNGWSSQKNFGADHLLRRDVIVVTANYRVGPFGFLSTGDDIIPGNAGLKDQNLALRWTKKYIGYFGGDPHRITIFGHSAGSASVSYHLLSPQSRGLFSAAIQQSGSALGPWAMYRNQSRIAHDLAKAINPDEYSKHNSSSKALLEYLQSVSADQIDAASLNLKYTPYETLQLDFLFGPVIEVEHEGAFVTKKPYEEFQKGSFFKVPVMMGFTSEEELALLADPTVGTITRLMDEHKELAIPVDMNCKPEFTTHIANTIYNKYSGNDTFVHNPRNLVKYMTAHYFIRSVHKQAHFNSKYGELWLYRFAYKGTMTKLVQVPVKGFSPDVTHGEELFYIFAFDYVDHNTTDVSIYPKSDILVHNRLITLWTNFAKFHNPTPVRDEILHNITWSMFDASRENYLHIGSEIEIDNHPEADNVQFWETLYDKYGSPPYDTY